MRIMTIGTTDAVVKHLALNKRSINVVFVTDLSVWMIGGVNNDLAGVVIVKVTAD